MSVICLLQTKHGSILTNSGYNLLETPAAFQGEEVAMGQAISSSFSCCSDSHTESSESEAAAPKTTSSRQGADCPWAAASSAQHTTTHLHYFMLLMN